MKTIDIIHDEHRALAAVLQAMGFVVNGLREAKFEPDFRLLSAMTDYITQVPEKVHHPKEDRFLFSLLRSRSAKAAALIDTLEREHNEGYGLTDTLKEALIHYQSVGSPGLPNFSAVVQKYLDFNWGHLNREESELLPLAREALSEKDWAGLDAEFSANFDPHSGAQGEFEELFKRIVNLTPAPYGLA